MADKEKQEKQELSLDDIKKQLDDVKSEIKSVKDENTQLKEQITQKDLEIAKLSLGGVEKKVVKENKVEDEEVEFDFDF